MSSSKILVPLDGSPASLRALDFAIEQLVRNKEGSLILLHVLNLGSVDPAGVSAMMPDLLSDAAGQASAHALNDAVQKCDQQSIPYKTHTRAGPQVAAGVAEVAREEGVSQIIMGTRGLGGFKGLLLGSVANQVLHLVEAPITLIK
jgi:nucleotide-binding universal stress UspA family protein